MKGNNKLQLIDGRFYLLSVEEVLELMGVKDSQKGLDREKVIQRREKYGLNKIYPPVNCPEWICCLLPCIMRTKAMVLFSQYTPHDAIVSRNDKKIKIDSSSLVNGDIIHLSPGDIIPADIRFLRCSNDLLMDIKCFKGSSYSRECRNSTYIRDDTLNDETFPFLIDNLGFMGCSIIQGTATAIVIGTGIDTIWSQLIQSKHWPILKSNEESFPFINS